MEIKTKTDVINKTQTDVFLGQYRIGCIHGPCLKGDFVCYTTDNPINIVSKNTFDECFNYIKSYIKE
jgi:hypothetical protein